MKTEDQIYAQVINYLNILGYGSEMLEYEVGTPSDRGVDLVVNSGKEKLIAIEIKSQSNIFNIPETEISYHPVARQLQRYADEMGAPYFIVSDGNQTIWLKTGENGRPKVINPIRASELRGTKLSDYEFIEATINHGVGFLENFPISGDISFDLSLAIFTKLKSDLNIPNDEIGAYPVNLIYKENYSNLVNLLDRWNDVNFYENKKEVLKYIDNFLSKNKHELKVPRWLAKFMVELYPIDEAKDLALDLFSRYGLLMSSAMNNGWKEVKGFYLNKSEEYWIRSQELISTGHESLPEFYPGLLINVKSIKDEGRFDLILLMPPLGLGSKTNFSIGKADSIELLIDKALSIAKEKGFIIAIVPDSVLLSSKYANLRKYIVQNFYVKGIINLTPEVFKPYSYVSTSIVIVQKCLASGRSTFFGSLDEVPANTERNNNKSLILNNWKSFCQNIKFETGKTGFEVDDIVSDNLHFSNYWYKEFHYGMDPLQPGFQAIPLKEVSKEIKRGKPYKRDSHEEIAYLAPASIRAMQLVDGDLSYTSEQLEPLNPVKVIENDIVINIIGTQRGSAAIVDKNFEGLGINHHLIMVRPNLSMVNPFYLAIALNSEYVQKQLHASSGGTVIPALNLSSFESLYIPIPPIFIQNTICEQFINALELVHKKEEELYKQKSNLKELLSNIGRRNEL